MLAGLNGALHVLLEDPVAVGALPCTAVAVGCFAQPAALLLAPCLYIAQAALWPSESNALALIVFAIGIRVSISLFTMLEIGLCAQTSTVHQAR